MGWAPASRAALWTLLSLAPLVASSASAVVRPSRVRYHSFPVPQRVAEQMWFWEAVFNRYPASSAIVHDPDHPQLIIDIVDLNAFAKRYNGGKPYTPSEKKTIIEKYAKRYELAMKRFADEGKEATRHGPMEKRIFNVYRKNSAAYADLLAGKINVRTQTGLADEFHQAADRAQKYLPYMERIFRERGLPADLTRIAFVESMFNVEAISKVGASGIWQFMPGTARHYLTLAAHIDERNSPLKATRAAAKLLESNFEQLKSWPLAITAYNHGAYGMMRAVKQVGTKDFGEIIANYVSRSFGFASRNFYAEFLAARKVYNNQFAEKGDGSEDPLGITRVRLTKPISVHQLLRYTSLTADVLKKYNPCLLPAAFTSHKYKALPRNYELIVPHHIVDEIRRDISRIAAPTPKKRYKS